MSDTTFVLWHYDPSFPVAIAFCVVFGLLTASHLGLRIAKGTKLYNPIIVGGVFEVIGYGARAVAHSNQDSTIVYAMQSLFLLLAPILFAASVYMFLGRLIYSTGRSDLAPVRPAWITRLFVGGDITCFLVQAAGGGILSAAKSQTTVDIGNYVILTGLVLQILVFLVFITVAGLFHLRLASSATDIKTHRTDTRLFMLYATSILITARNVYRVLEYALGQNGYLITHEWSLYAFDAGLMTIVMVVCLLWYTNGSNQTMRTSADQEMQPFSK